MRKHAKWLLLLTSCALLSGCAGNSPAAIQNDSIISIPSSPTSVSTESLHESEEGASHAEPAMPDSAGSAVPASGSNAPTPTPEEPRFKIWTDRDLVYPEAYDVTLEGIAPDIAEQARIDTDALIKAVGDFAYERNIRLSTVEYVKEQRTNLDSSIANAYILRLNGDPRMDITVLHYEPTGQYILFMNEFFPETTPAPTTAPQAGTGATTPAPESFEIRNIPQDAVNLLQDTEAFRDSLYAYLTKSGVTTDAVEILEDSLSQDAGRYSMMGACQYGQVVIIYIDPATGQTSYAIN